MPLICLLIIVGFRVGFAGDWQHYTMHNEIRDVARSNNTLWLAMPWGIRSVPQSGKVESYAPGNNGLEANDFVQIFALPDGNIIAASRDGVLVRKSKGKNFETISRSFIEKKRELLPALGKVAKNILVLPFNTAISFFDYEKKRSVITLERIGSNSLGEFQVRRVAVRGDSVWLDLGINMVWKRAIVWDRIYDDMFLADPYSWVKAESIPFEEDIKPVCASAKCTEGNIPLEKVETIAVLQGKGAVAWGDFNAKLSRKVGADFVSVFSASPFATEPWRDFFPRPNKSLALFADGSFAIGFEGAGIYTFNSETNAKVKRWYHRNNYSEPSCLTGIADGDDGWPTVHGLVVAPDSSGYIFSFVGRLKSSSNNYGLGFISKDGNMQCLLAGSSPSAGTIAVRENEASGEWELYVSWENDLMSGIGGVDTYRIRDNPSRSVFSPQLVKHTAFDFGMPKDLSFDTSGNLWAVSPSRIFYKKAGLNSYEWKVPDVIRNFDGATLTSLEIDPRNNLWIGSETGGAYKMSMEKGSADTLVAKRFLIKDGLMNETVYDIAIDYVLGLVYFANGMGLSVYSSSEVRNTAGYMGSSAPEVIAFPSPFRPSVHRNVIIDNVHEYSEVYIFDAAGRRVRLFRGADLLGGRAVWDGTSENGKLVAPGVYHYFAVRGKNTAKGKILIER